ncbi:MAG: hypothetical protein ACTSRD_08110, partial [Promethearchaeota archaeon]
MAKFYERLVIIWKYIKRSRMIKVIFIVLALNLILGGLYSLFAGVPFYMGFYWISDYITNTGTGNVAPGSTDHPGLWW